MFLTHPSLVKVEALYQFEGYPRWHVEMSPCGTSLGQTVLFKVTTTLFLVRVIGMTLNHSKPLTPMSDQDSISPYNINTISTR